MRELIPAFIHDQDVSRECERLGLNRRTMRYLSLNRDEDDRCAFWLNGPLAARPAGVRGVHFSRIV